LLLLYQYKYRNAFCTFYNESKRMIRQPWD